jgi:hypothetical protein
VKQAEDSFEENPSEKKVINNKLVEN